MQKQTQLHNYHIINSIVKLCMDRLTSCNGRALAMAKWRLERHHRRKSEKPEDPGPMRLATVEDTSQGLNPRTKIGKQNAIYFVFVVY